MFTSLTDEKSQNSIFLRCTSTQWKDLASLHFWQTRCLFNKVYHCLSHLTHRQGTCTRCWLQFQQQRFYWTGGRRRHTLCAQSCQSPCRFLAPAAQTGCRGMPARWSDTAQSPAGAAAGLYSVPQWSHSHWPHSPPGTPVATEIHFENTTVTVLRASNQQSENWETHILVWQNR